MGGCLGLFGEALQPNGRFFTVEDAVVKLKLTYSREV